MNKRAYYNDPLISAYMADKFGLKFEGCFWIEVEVYGGELSWVDPDAEEVGQKKYYIHPDSMHIFEPKDDDWGKTESDGYWVSRFNRVWWSAGIGGTTRENDAKVTIIQRDNKHFFMPEFEEDND